MAWYDWVFWWGVLYMAVGSDFGLNWLTGVAWGTRIHPRSKNPFNRIYHWVWASTDPMSGLPGAGKEANAKGGCGYPLQPGIIAVCQFNAFITLTLEVLILIGLCTQGPYLRPAVFIFVWRGILELLYAAQLIWGKPGLIGLTITHKSPSEGLQL